MKLINLNAIKKQNFCYCKYSEYVKSLCQLLDIDDGIDFKNKGTSPDLLSFQVDIENAFEKISLTIQVSFVLK